MTILDIKKVFVLDKCHAKVLTSRTHLNFSIFNEGAAALLKTLIEIFAGDDHTNARSKSLNLQTPVLDLRQHLLNGTDFVYYVKMISIVHDLMESTSKLLRRLHHGLNLDIGHLECLGEGVGLLLEHLEGGFDHVFLELIMNNLNLTSGLIMSFQNLRLFVSLHRVIDEESGVLFSHVCCFSVGYRSPIISDAVHMVIDLPVEAFSVLS